MRKSHLVLMLMKLLREKQKLLLVKMDLMTQLTLMLIALMLLLEALMMDLAQVMMQLQGMRRLHLVLMLMKVITVWLIVTLVLEAQKCWYLAEPKT